MIEPCEVWGKGEGVTGRFQATNCSLGAIDLSADFFEVCMRLHNQALEVSGLALLPASKGGLAAGGAAIEGERVGFLDESATASAGARVEVKGENPFGKTPGPEHPLDPSQGVDSLTTYHECPYIGPLGIRGAKGGNLLKS